MSCAYDRNTERYSHCDGHSRCYCPRCTSCSETVEKDGDTCSYCFETRKDAEAALTNDEAF